MPPRSRKLKVGDRVRIRYGTRRITAVVVEDRGFIGVGGRQLVRIRFGRGNQPVHEFEVPAEETRLVSAA